MTFSEVTVQWIVISFLALFMMIGIALVGSALVSMRRNCAAEDWPLAKGRLVSAELLTERDSEGETHHVKASYEYNVNGVLHTADRISYGYGATSSRSEHEALLARLKNDPHLNIRHSPDNPGTSVILTSLHHSLRWQLAFGFFWLAFTGILFFGCLQSMVK